MSLYCQDCHNFALSHEDKDDKINKIIMQRYLNQGVILCANCRLKDQQDFSNYELYELIASYRRGLNKNQTRELASEIIELIKNKEFKDLSQSVSSK